MEVLVTYRRTSRMSLRIGSKGEVRVSVPYGVPREEVMRFVEEKSDWIREALQRTVAAQQKRADFYNRLELDTPKKCREATARLNALIPPIVEKYSAQMGVRPVSIRYKATISRWGCCNTRTKVIEFSAYLLLLPEWLVEHVVVHELAHLIVPNHSAAFHAVMDKHFPRWREARQATRQLVRNSAAE